MHVRTHHAAHENLLVAFEAVVEHLHQQKRRRCGGCEADKPRAVWSPKPVGEDKDKRAHKGTPLCGAWHEEENKWVTMKKRCECRVRWDYGCLNLKIFVIYIHTRTHAYGFFFKFFFCASNVFKARNEKMIRFRTLRWLRKLWINHHIIFDEAP